MQKILILRPDNLGDLILFSGALQHLRRHYPDAHIALCVQTQVLDYFEYCPHVNVVVPWEKLIVRATALPALDWFPNIRGKRRIQELISKILLRNDLERYRVDTLIFPLRSPATWEYSMHDIVKQIPAKEKFGIGGDYANQSQEEDARAETIYTRRLHITESRRYEHEFVITRDFLQMLGARLNTEQLWPEYWNGPEDINWACQAIPPKNDLILDLAICPGVTFQLKRYNAQHYAQAISLLKDWRFRIILFGSRSDTAICTRVEDTLKNCSNVLSVLNLAGQTTIRQSIEGIKKCDLVLSNDSAALHIAAMLRKPAVGIMGGGQYGRFYPWGDTSTSLVANKTLDCYWCNWRCIYPSARCIDEITPETIASNLIRLLQTMPKHE